MSQIDETYFQQRLIAIPNLNEDSVSSRLQSYIDLKEDDYFIDVLGQELKDLYLSGIGEVTPDQKWTDLQNGAIFECSGRQMKWTGFLNDIKDSPIAYYTYFYLVREGNSILTGTGVVESVNENSNKITPLVKLVDAWSYMVKKNRLLKLFIEANISDYPEYDPTDCLIENINYFGI